MATGQRKPRRRVLAADAVKARVDGRSGGAPQSAEMRQLTLISSSYFRQFQYTMTA